MTNGQVKAINMLLDPNGLLGENARLPKVFIIGNDVTPYFAAALRSQRNHFFLYGEKLDIEVMTIEQAYELRFREPNLPQNLSRLMNLNFDSIGHYYAYENFYPWQVAKYKDNTSVNFIFSKVL